AGMLQPGVIKPLAPKAPDPAPAAPAEPAPAPAAPVPVAAAPVAEQPPAAPAAPAPDPVDEAKKKAAAELLTKADASFAAKKWKEAHGAYTEALGRFGPVLPPEQTASANSNLARAAMEMRQNVPPPSPVLEDHIKGLNVQIQQFYAEFNNALMEANNAIATSNTDKARGLVAMARLRLSEMRGKLSEPQVNELTKKVDAVSADLDKAIEVIRKAEADAREKSLASMSEDEKRRDQQGKAQKIRENIDRVRALQRERKYSEALQVVGQILFLDPLNPSGLLLKDVLTDMKVYSEYNKGEDAIGRSIQQLSLDNLGALMVPHAIVDYPSDWPSISALRSEALAYQESPENRRVLATLENTRLPKVDFPDTTVKAALEYLRTVANLNMDVDWKSLEAVGIQQDATVSLSITNPTLKTVLNRVLDKVSNALDPNSRAGWTVADGVLQVASSDQLKRHKLMIIYDVKDLLFDVTNKTNVPEFDLQQAFQGSAGGGGGGGGGGQSPFNNQNNQNQDTQRPLEERINDLRKIIVEQVDRDGWSDNGGDTGTIQPFRDNLIINTTPANHRDVEGLLGQLRRVRNMQINVEARFLTVSQDFYEKIGFNANVYFGANGSQFTTLRAAGNYDVLPSDFFSGGKYSPPRTLPGGSQTLWILGANGLPIPTALQGPLFPYTVNPPPPTGLGPVGAISNSSSLVNTLLGASTSKFGTQAALGISGTYLDDIQVDFLVEATQSDKRSVSVNAPRLTFSNGQYAYVAVADQQAYVSALRPAAGQGTIGLEPQINFVNDGITLYVGGVILADRRYVQLDVKIVVSALKALISRDITAVAGGAGGVGGGGGGAPGTVTGQIQLPEVVVQTVETTVTVPDQGTVLLGGQRLSKEVEAESGVPVLSKIPILNRFFSNRAMTREEFSLLMLIKPTVLIQDETEDTAFPGLRDALRTGGL
ncbi:MAG: hypothetical protein AABZ53_04335, partial [Planctomycetota bacterium]